MTSHAAHWIVFALLGCDAWRDDRPWRIDPADVLDQWHATDADDDHIRRGLRLALPRKALPLPDGLSFAVEQAEVYQPVALVVTDHGRTTRLDEDELVAVVRALLAADDPPTAPGPAPAHDHAPPPPTHAAEARASAPATAVTAPRLRPDAPPRRPSPPPRPEAKAPTQQLVLF